MAKTKKPTGFKVTRNGNSYQLSWKISDKNYGNGQQLEYRLKIDGKWEKKWRKISGIGKNTTSKSITVNKAGYFPYGKKLDEIAFRVRGNRKSYRKTWTTGKGRHKKTHHKNINPSWSDWTNLTYDVQPPRNPSVSVALDDTLANVSYFSWNVVYNNEDRYIFNDVLWESILIKDCNTDKGKEVASKFKKTAPGWRTGTGKSSGTIAITEDTALLANGSYTRWFRVRARGPQGTCPDWVYSRHVYAIPNVPVIQQATIKNASTTGYTCYVKWSITTNKVRPVDIATVQYAIVTPVAGLGCPSGASWTDAHFSRDTDGKYAASFTIDDTIGYDEALFVRVGSKHDANINYSVPKRAGVGSLTAPSNLQPGTAQESGDNYSVPISADNNSSVPDSFLVVVYRTASEPSKDIICGIIPHGQTDITVVVPKWGEEAYSFGVYAVQGSYTSTPRVDGVTQYAVTENTRSTTYWGTGDTPKAPTDVAATQLDDGTIKITWSWAWENATEAEISWSDYKDAWMSTKAPESHAIEGKVTEWYIPELERGKTWYIRVRLSKEDVKGAWSDIVEIDLASVPIVGNLKLSEAQITNKGNTTLSWDYTTEDGTEQLTAAIYEATINQSSLIPSTDSDDNNVYENTENATTIVYGTEPIAMVGDSQSVVLFAETLGWQAGSTHTLAVKVFSGSGKWSEFSSPISVNVAPLITCEITESSLIKQYVPNGGDIVTDNEPYYLRRSGGSKNALIGDMAYDTIIGGSVVFNQLIEPFNTTSGGVTSVFNSATGVIELSGTSTGTYSNIMYNKNVVQRHKYYVKLSAVTNPNNISFTVGLLNAGVLCSVGSAVIQQSNRTGVSGVGLADYAAGTDFTGVKIKAIAVDLTQMFGTTIADYVYQLEQSTAGSGVSYLKSLGYFTDDYYPYNAGEIKSVSGLSSHDMTGFNQWDEEWEVGGIRSSDGTNSTDANRIRAKNLIPVVETTYYVKAPSNLTAFYYDMNKDFMESKPIGSNITFIPINGAKYMRFTVGSSSNPVTTYNNDISINISDPNRNGEYEPYIKHAYPLDNTLTLRGIPKLSDGKIYYDGDVYNSDGSVVRKYGVVDLGTLTWTGSNGIKLSTDIADVIKPPSGNNVPANIIAEKYVTLAAAPIVANDGNIGVETSGRLQCGLSDNPTGYLIYELAEPTTESAEPYSTIQLCDGAGTEEYVTTGIPVGHETRYAPAGGGIRYVNVLTQMSSQTPLQLTVTGAGQGGKTTVTIERAESYHMDRPDERDFDGYENEVIAIYNQIGDEPISLDQSNLIGVLDDGAKYRIVATVSDNLGQRAKDTIDFEVHWTHQALIPTAACVIDDEYRIAKLTVTAPEGAVDGDTFDIYRLSVDRPELILEAGTWGTQYVDPYPTIGTFGGHRVVFKSLNGDYITEDNKPAWVDLGVEENDFFDFEKTIIDFGEDTVFLDYQVDTSFSWDKDFQETRYLGGSVQGDWGKSVVRKGSVDGGIIEVTDPDQIEAIRRLAEYTGICHVRTEEGSSFAADVQVSENRKHNSYDMFATFSLSITRVDVEQLDAIPYTDWYVQEEE